MTYEMLTAARCRARNNGSAIAHPNMHRFSPLCAGRESKAWQYVRGFNDTMYF